MSCNCTGNCDLISINNIVLSDTFQTWYDRTNQIIDAINPIQIYDVNVGSTDGGLTAQSTCPNGNNNGVLTLKVWNGPGIGFGNAGYYPNRTLIDMSNMLVKGSTGYDEATIANRPSAAFPANGDWMIVSDTNDSSLASGQGTPKRIMVNHMLPPTVYLPNGFQFNGDISINGNLSVQGTQSTVDSNDVRIEDKVLELAYHRIVSLDVTGPTYGNAFLTPGLTMYYYDPGVGNTAAYTTVGHISSVTALGSGKTNIKLHKFIEGGVNDIVAGGRLSVTGSYFDFTMSAGPTTTNSFYTDIDLSEAGIQVDGSSSNKAFVWVYQAGPAADIYNSFVTNTNLGVSGDSNSIISTKFASYGYNNANENVFRFYAYDGTEPKITLGGLGTGSDEKGYWSITRKNYSLTGPQQPLVFAFKQHIGAGETASFTIWSGASGPTYGTISVSGQSNNRVENFAEGLNVDFLDGAHGTTMPTAWSIPVALATGKIDTGWVDTDSISKCYSMTGHGFSLGDVIRLNGNNGSLTGSIATSVENAEVLGMVSKVTDANNFCIVTKGYVYNLTGPAGSNIASILPLATGNCYFLSPDNQGALIADPDTGAHALEFGEVRKPMFIALSSNSGYVQNYLGVVEGAKTDIVDVQGLNPVGMIMPYTGGLDTIPYGWKVCDGARLEKSLWSELYAAIGQSYYAEGYLSPSYVAGNVPVIMTGGNRGMQVNDAITIEATVNGTVVTVDTYVTAVSTTAVTFTNFDVNAFGGQINYRIRGRVDTTGGSGSPAAKTSIFFLPDIRRRVLVGATRGLTGGLTPDITPGDAGGKNQQTLEVTNIPPHGHRLSPSIIKSPFAEQNTTTIGSGYVIDGIPDETNDQWYTANGPLGVSEAQPFDNMPEYVTVHWIIRARKGLTAMILSGHSHDDRYIRYDASQSLTSLNRSTFRNNAKVLGNGYDGNDSFRARLTITGGAVVGDDATTSMTVNSSSLFVGGATFSNSFGINRATGKVYADVNKTRITLDGEQYYTNAGIADILIENGASAGTWDAIATTDANLLNAALKIRGGTESRASMVIFNDNASGYLNGAAANNDGMNIHMYGHALTGNTIDPKYAGGVRGIIDTGTVVGTTSRQIGFQLGGGNTPNVPEDVLTFRRVDTSPSVVSVKLPKGLQTATTTEANAGSSVILTTGNELKKTTPTSLKTNVGMIFFSWSNQGRASSPAHFTTSWGSVTLPAGTWNVVAFPQDAVDGGGEDDNWWWFKPAINAVESEGFNIQTWISPQGAHYNGSNWTGFGMAFRIG